MFRGSSCLRAGSARATEIGSSAIHLIVAPVRGRSGHRSAGAAPRAARQELFSHRMSRSPRPLRPIC